MLQMTRGEMCEWSHVRVYLDDVRCDGRISRNVNYTNTARIHVECNMDACCDFNVAIGQTSDIEGL